MDVCGSSADSFNNNGKPPTQKQMNPDDILLEMIRSGNYSKEQVVEFCIQVDIPLSRMLRLDLMRETSKGHSSTSTSSHTT